MQWPQDDSLARATNTDLDQSRLTDQEWTLADIFLYESIIKKKLKPAPAQNLKFKVKSDDLEYFKGTKKTKKAELDVQINLLLKQLNSDELLRQMVNPKNEVAFMIFSSTREQDTISAVPKVLGKIFPSGI